MAFFPQAFGMQMPPTMAPGMPPIPMSNFYGKTRYKYKTADGGPPNMAMPPGADPPSGPPPPYCPFGMPGMQPGGSPFLYPPGSAPPASGWVFVGAGGTAQSAPAPAPANAPPQAPPPLSGNRVKGQLAKFPNSAAGYVFDRYNAVVHLFKDNILNKYHTNVHGHLYIPGNVSELFTVEYVSCRMPMTEFIEQIDTVNRAGANYPREMIGIQELIERGNGWFELGSKFMVDEPMTQQTKVGSMWPNSVGEAGQHRPVYLVRLPN